MSQRILVLDGQTQATLVAALTYYLENGQGDPSRRSGPIHDLATGHDAQISMDDEGIACLIQEVRRAGRLVLGVHEHKHGEDFYAYVVSDEVPFNRSDFIDDLGEALESAPEESARLVEMGAVAVINGVAYPDDRSDQNEETA